MLVRFLLQFSREKCSFWASRKVTFPGSPGCFNEEIALWAYLVAV